MTDKIYLEDFTLLCRVGTTPEERESPQTLTLSVEIERPLERAGRTDSLAETLDYDALRRDVIHALASGRYHLIEAVAEIVSDLCLERPGVVGVRVSVAKTIYSDVRRVGVTIERRRK